MIVKWLLWIGDVLDLTLIGATLTGFLIGVIWVAFALIHFAFDPFPTFGADLGYFDRAMFKGFAILWSLWAVSAFWRAVRARWDSISFLYLISLLAASMGACLWFLGMSTVNALLDSSPKVVTPIYVHRFWSSIYHSARGEGTSGHADVSRLDHPDERITIAWDGCDLPFHKTSRYAKLKIGRGLLGVPWFSLPVQCRPLAIDDDWLFKDFYLGRGRPAVLLTMHHGSDGTNPHEGFQDVGRALNDALDALVQGPASDFHLNRYRVRDPALTLFTRDDYAAFENLLGERDSLEACVTRARAYANDVLLRRDPDLRARYWIEPIERSFPGVAIGIVWEDGDSADTPAGLCSRCRARPRENVYRDLLDLFLGDEADRRDDEERIYIADAKGARVFAARLRDLEQRPRLLEKLATLPVPPPAGASH